jgi:hypothetical protein
MALIWRCAARAAKESLVNRIPIDSVLREIGWEIHPDATRLDDDMTAKEMTMWIQRNAREIKNEQRAV